MGLVCSLEKQIHLPFAKLIDDISTSMCGFQRHELILLRYSRRISTLDSILIQTSEAELSEIQAIKNVEA